MARVERSITIDAPVEKVFAYIDNPVNELEWFPGLMEVGDVTGKGVGARSHFTYKMIGIRLEGESTVTEYVPNERIVTQSKGGIVSIWTWTFKPQNGRTKLTVVVDYTIPIPVLGKLAEAVAVKWTEREADMATANIKARMEA
jgi:uncharacterized membrane protein